MTGSANTTPSGRIRRSRLGRRSRRPSASRPPATSSASCWGCGCPAHWPPSRSRRSRRPPSGPIDAGAAPRSPDGGPVEFDRVVPPSGNLWAMRRQFWLGPQRAGQTVRFWADVDVIHLSIAGARVKSLRSHLSIADLAQLARQGAVAAGPPPLPPAEDGAAIEVDRAVNNSGLVGLGGRQVLAAEILGGRPVIVRIEPQTLMFLDPDTRELLRVRPNPLTPEQALRLQGARPAGPPPRPTDRADHRSAPRQRHRRDLGLPPTRRARAHPRRAHRHRPRLRAHARRSSSTTKPGRSAAPPTGPSSSSRAADRSGPGQRQRNSRPAPSRQRRITNRSRQ